MIKRTPSPEAIALANLAANYVTLRKTVYGDGYSFDADGYAVLVQKHLTANANARLDIIMAECDRLAKEDPEEHGITSYVIYCKARVLKGDLAAKRKYNKPTCKGSYILGSACGHCERCEEERALKEEPTA